jgi:hypothetical protein
MTTPIEQKVWETLAENMRPDWAAVDDSLCWWAVDPDGTCMYFAEEPRVVDDLATWYQPDGVYAEFDKRIVLPLGLDWRLTLLQRPCKPLREG